MLLDECRGSNIPKTTETTCKHEWMLSICNIAILQLSDIQGCTFFVNFYNIWSTNAKKSCVVMIFLILIDNSKRSHVYVPQWSPASAQRQPLCRYNRSNFYFQLIFFLYEYLFINFSGNIQLALSKLCTLRQTNGHSFSLREFLTI